MPSLGFHPFVHIWASAKIIVPDDATVVVEANILNKDIGFIREGQPVRGKLEVFNFTDYGIVPGVVESISPDVIDSNQPSSQAPGDDQARGLPIAYEYLRL